jgi:hypothetical protein
VVQIQRAGKNRYRGRGRRRFNLQTLPVVERASLARPWQAGEHRDAHLVAVSTLWRNVCLFTRKSAARRCFFPVVNLAYHGLASEARSTQRLKILVS